VQQGHLSLDHPDQFPHGLGGVFYQYFQRQFPDQEQYEKNIQPALGAILASIEPLPAGVLQSLFAWREAELRKWLRVFGSLFPVTNQAGNEVIRPCHKSLLDWMTDQSKSGMYFVSLKEGHQILAEHGWKMLSEPGAGSDGSLILHLPYHLCEAGDPNRLLHLLASGRFNYFEQWAEKGMPSEGVRCLEFLDAFLSTLEGAASLRAMLATQLGRLCNRLDRPEEADRWLRQALSSKENGLNEDGVKSVAWHELGSAALARGDCEQALKAYRNALRISRKTKPPLFREIAANLIGLALVFYSKDLRTARTVKLASLALWNAETAKDAPHMAEACRMLADVYKDSMRVAEAERFLERGLDIARQNKFTHATMSLLTSRGWLLYQCAALGERDPENAESAFKDALAAAQSAQDRRYAADAWSGLGQCGVLSNREDLIRKCIRNIAGSGSAPPPPHIEARRLLIETSLIHRKGKFAQAQRAYAEIEAFSREHALWSRMVDAIVGQGAAAFHSGNTALAEWHWSRVQPILPRCPLSREAISAYVIRAARTDPKQCPL
jgi:tetratricopeptide (TPR) repeat protein